jgi:hypothetical protein
MRTTEDIKCTIVHLICFLQFMTQKIKNRTLKKGTAVHVICSKKYLRRYSTIKCTIVQLYALQYTKVHLQYQF